MMVMPSAYVENIMLIQDARAAYRDWASLLEYSFIFIAPYIKPGDFICIGMLGSFICSKAYGVILSGNFGSFRYRFLAGNASWIHHGAAYILFDYEEFRHRLLLFSAYFIAMIATIDVAITMTTPLPLQRETCFRYSPRIAAPPISAIMTLHIRLFRNMPQVACFSSTRNRSKYDVLFTRRPSTAFILSARLFDEILGDSSILRAHFQRRTFLSHLAYALISSRSAFFHW